jgi:hypothetical protein
MIRLTRENKGLQKNELHSMLVPPMIFLSVIYRQEGNYDAASKILVFFLSRMIINCSELFI